MNQAPMPLVARQNTSPSETTIVETRPSTELSALISNLSHSLRTPLNPVLGFLELLLETELDSTQREYIEQAHSGALDIDRLLTSLNTRLHTSGQQQLQPRGSGRTGDSRPRPRPDVWSPRVLIVDDDPVNRQVADHMLKRLGYEADTACDGMDAVQRAIDREYDLILMDLQMPQMGGLDAIDAIREALPQHHQPMIYAVTAGAASEDRDRFELSGMDGCMTKPVRLNDLKDVIESLLESPRASRAWALALQVPSVPIVDVEALDEWIGVPGMATSLVDLVAPTLLTDLGELIGRLELAGPDGDSGLLDPAAEMSERARSVFMGRLTWTLDHLVASLRRADWTAAATLTEPLLREFMALEEWMNQSKPG